MEEKKKEKEKEKKKEKEKEKEKKRTSSTPPFVLQKLTCPFLLMGPNRKIKVENKTKKIKGFPKIIQPHK